jgi:hypothetical protein
MQSCTTKTQFQVFKRHRPSRYNNSNQTSVLDNVLEPQPRRFERLQEILWPILVWKIGRSNTVDLCQCYERGYQSWREVLALQTNSYLKDLPHSQEGPECGL